VKISVFGLGYVGCVSGACLARDGHSVIGVDVNPQKLELLRSGRSPIIEPDLDCLVKDVVRSGKLRTSTDPQMAVRNTDVSVICVGTPSNGNGSLCLQHIKKVCAEIGTALVEKSGYHVVVVRSTVLPGTVEETLIPVLENDSRRQAGRDFGVCMNPEFLREGSALEDYDHPSQIVIGELDVTSGDVVRQMYGAIEAPVVRTTIRTAEMVKYVNNAFHAMKVVFSNEVGNLSKAHGIDGQEVMEIFCRDRRLNISATYLRPGFAFGGSCLPKDLRALLYRAKERDLDCPVLSAVLRSNDRQLQRGIQMVEAAGRKRIGVFGLSFKSGTDDVRESPVVPLIETLVGRGYEVLVYDEKVEPNRLVGANKAYLERELPHIASLMRPSVDDVLTQAEVVVLANGSSAFAHLRKRLRDDQVMVDLVGVAKGKNDNRGRYAGLCW
jgi:GDP-mannose 6-dehydrogenase